ncbi:MAG: hypothetical protein IKU27_01385, partial [Clostridia bacterium]|nr:hypothetical protein [Clostridia bacterium]
IHFFEGRTGCPHRIISKKLSEPVIKAIESCWSTIQATKQEWNMTAEYLDLYYRTTIEPQVKKALTDEIPKFLEVMQYTNRITEQVLAKHKDKK